MSKETQKENSLASVNPELAKQWHPIKNGELSPLNISGGSAKKVWWKCEERDYHEWEATIYNRSKGSGCPYCSGRKATRAKSLASVNSKLAKEWHPKRNLSISPFDVLPLSNKKVWWKCKKGDDHEWEAVIANRSKGSGCPICLGQKAVRSNSLAVTNPELSSQWHPKYNGELTPFDVTFGSGKKIWWKCEKGDDHEWKASLYSRSKGLMCPICAGQKAVRSNSLAVTNPELSSQWHPKYNGELTPFDVTFGSVKKIWWKCEKGYDHDYIASIAKRSSGRGCTVCSGHKVVLSNCLMTINPDLAAEWHATKNRDLTPYDVTVGSGKKVWWQCKKGDDHEWEASIPNRIKGSGCAICSGYKVVLSNCLMTLNPKWASEWHPTKNGTMTPLDVVPGSTSRVWWKCYKGDDHEWITSLDSRRGCPYCTLTPQSRQELIITHELITIFKDIDPKGFKISTDGKLRSIDIYIQELKLGIEFDGAYWHKGKRELDKLKTEELESVGLNIIRVRQKPLNRIFDSDVMAEKKYDGKAITNGVLQQILKDYKLDKRTLNKIHKYILKPDLQNEKGLDVYIDMILTEKAERNQLST